MPHLPPTPTLTRFHEAATPSYPRPGSIQSASVWQRLRRRRLTPRALLAYAAGLGLLIFAAPMPASFAAGAVIVASGLTLRIWTFGHLHKNQTLATTGPYAHTRNPAYLGSALIMTGLFLAAGNPDTMTGIALWCTGVLGLAFFFAAYLPRKYSREYGQLAELFPAEIQRHADHVPNFFPRLTPWHSGDPRRFSWHCVNANHEIAWPLICAAALAAMWLG